MKWLINFYGRILNFLLFLFTRKKRYRTVIIDDIPKTLAPDVIYIVGKKEYTWCLIMKCPCKCNDLIHLNLLPQGKPRWSYKIHLDRTISVYPSVWRIKGCRSHFFLKKGLVKWC